MSRIWSRLDGRLPQEQRRQLLLSHQFDTDMRESGEDEQYGAQDSGKSLQCSTLVMPSATALLVSSDVRISYSQGKTSVVVALSGPATSKHEATYEKAEVVVRLQSHVGVLALQPLFAVGSAPEKRRFFEARHQELHETYASVLLPLVQASTEAVLCLEQFPRCVIVIDVVVEEQDGGLFSTVLNGIMCAILEAGLPCRTTFAAITVAALTADVVRPSVDNDHSRLDARKLNDPESVIEHLKRKRENEKASPMTKMRRLSNECCTSTSTSGGAEDLNLSTECECNDSCAGVASSSSLCYFVDPSSVEENLSGCPKTLSENLSHLSLLANGKDDGNKNASDVSQTAAIFQTERGQLLKMQLECQTVAVGTFVMSYRPSSGTTVRYPTIASHVQSGPGMSRASSQDSLKTEEWLHMEEISNVSAARIFDFYRKLNDPLE